jgi:hypothetical protein
MLTNARLEEKSPQMAPVEIDVLRRRLRTIQNLLRVALGCALTLLIMAPTWPSAFGVEGPGWFVIWFVLWLAPAGGGMLLMMAPAWRRLPMRERWFTVWSALALSWLATLIWATETVVDFWGYAVMHTDLRLPPQAWMVTVLIVTMLGIGLILAYGGLKRKALDQAEEMFP